MKARLSTGTVAPVRRAAHAWRGPLLVLLCTVLATTPASAEIVEPGTLDGTVRTASGGHAVLLEHATATWCEVCAVVDPVLDPFMHEVGDRMIRVALHPHDEEDVLGSPLATHRLLRYADPGTLDYPSFLMEGDLEWAGLTDESQFRQELLSAEGRRLASEELSLTTAFTPSSLEVTLRLTLSPDTPLEGTQLALFLVEDEVVVTGAEDINGVGTHHDVAQALLEVGVGAVPVTGDAVVAPASEWSWPPDSWQRSLRATGSELVLRATLVLPAGLDLWRLGVVGVHEEAEPQAAGARARTVHGAVQLIQQEPEDGMGGGTGWLLVAGIMLAAGVTLVWRPRGGWASQRQRAAGLGRGPGTAQRAAAVWAADRAQRAGGSVVAGAASEEA